MWKRRILGFSITVLLFSTNPAEAVSCRDVKRSYEQSLNEYQDALNKYKELQSRYDSVSAKSDRDRQSKESEKLRKKCVEEAKKSSKRINGLTPRQKCSVDSFNRALKIYQSGLPSSTTHEIALDTAQRIVLNNMNCFDPKLVAEIQRVRG